MTRHWNNRFRTWLDDRLSIECKIELNWHFSVFLFSTQSRVDSLYCRLLTRWVDDRVVSWVFLTVLTRSNDEFFSQSFAHSQSWWSSRVDFLYCFNAVERWILFICRLFSRGNDEQSRAIDEYEFAFEESFNISKDTSHDLSNRTALSEQLQHHCHEQHTLTRTHNLLKDMSNDCMNCV